MGTVLESVEYWGNRARREAMGYPEDPADVGRESQVLPRGDVEFILLFQKPIERMGMAEALSAYLVQLTVNLADRDPVVAQQKAGLEFHTDLPLKTVIDRISVFLVMCLDHEWGRRWFIGNGKRLLDAITMAERIMKFTGGWK